MFSILQYPNVLHLSAGGFGQLGAERLTFQVCYDGLAIG